LQQKGPQIIVVFNIFSMKLMFGMLVLLVSSVASAQSLKDSLFRGKMKIDSAKYKIAPAPKKPTIDSTMTAAQKDSVTALIVQDSIKNYVPPPPVVVKAVFPAGEKAWKKFIDNAVNYVTIDAGERGVKKGFYDISISFAIDSNGAPIEIEIRPSPNQEYFKTAFAERIKRSPKWTPATSNGEYTKYVHTQEVQVVIK
jgi:hypothetical protein